MLLVINTVSAITLSSDKPALAAHSVAGSLVQIQSCAATLITTHAIIAVCLLSLRLGQRIVVGIYREQAFFIAGHCFYTALYSVAGFRVKIDIANPSVYFPHLLDVQPHVVQSCGGHVRVRR